MNIINRNYIHVESNIRYSARGGKYNTSAACESIEINYKFIVTRCRRSTLTNIDSPLVVFEVPTYMTIQYIMILIWFCSRKEKKIVFRIDKYWHPLSPPPITFTILYVKFDINLI